MIILQCKVVTCLPVQELRSDLKRPLVTINNGHHFFHVCLHILLIQVVVEDGHSWIDVTEMRLSFEYTVYYQHWTR